MKPQRDGRARRLVRSEEKFLKSLHCLTPIAIVEATHAQSGDRHEGYYVGEVSYKFYSEGVGGAHSEALGVASLRLLIDAIDCQLGLRGK